MGVKVKRKARFVSLWSQRGSESGLRVKVTSGKQGGDDGKKREPSSQTFLSRLRSHQDIPPCTPPPPYRNISQRSQEKQQLPW